MRGSAVRGGILAVSLATSLGGCGGGGGDPVAHDAWVRLPAVSGRPAAAYLTIQGGRENVRLNTLRVPAARRVELHETVRDGAVMSMRPVGGVDVAAGTTVSLAPGGIHAMLHDLDPALKPGGTTRMTLVFDSAPPIELDAKLTAPGATAPE